MAIPLSCRGPNKSRPASTGFIPSIGLSRRRGWKDANVISQKAKYAFKALVVLARREKGASLQTDAIAAEGCDSAKIPRADPSAVEGKRPCREPPRAQRRIFPRGRARGDHRQPGASDRRRADCAARLHFPHRLRPLQGLQGRDALRRPAAFCGNLRGDACKSWRKRRSPRRWPTSRRRVVDQAGHGPAPQRGNAIDVLSERALQESVSTVRPS